MSYDYSENILVQESAGNLLRDELGWDVQFAHSSETLGENGTFGRKSYKEILLTRFLVEALKKFNPWINETQITEAVKILENRLSTSSLLQVNEEKYYLIRDGIPVTIKKPNGETQAKKATVIDFLNPENNYFLAIKELKIHGELHRRRTDIVGFVNGIPLLFAELKNSSVDVRNAYEDNYTDYQDTVPHLFYYNAIIVLSNGMEAKVGTLGSKFEFFHEWKRLAEDEQGSVVLETMLRGICKKENFLDLFENFILYDHSNGHTAKILARNHQYLGVNEAMKVYAARKLNDGKLGVFWHTQGSGKSYSMLFFAKKVRRKMPGTPTFVILTDRDELNTQISDTFENCGLLGKDIKASQYIATSGSDLVQKLKGNPSFIFTLIQKFNKPNEEPIYPDHDIIIISDEAHRSQYGIFADNMMKLLPTAARIGFTGTPLLSSDNITARTFGGYVSVYDFKRAVEDGATVPLYYENRGEKIVDLQNPEITDQILDAIENADLDINEQDKLEAKFAKEIHLLTAEPRLKSIARDFVRHYCDLWTSGKAMFVCLNKVTCVRMYNFVQECWQEEIKTLKENIKRATQQEAQELERKLKWMQESEMAVIISQDQNEIQTFKKWGLDIKYHREKMEKRELDKEFKDSKNPLRVVFVCAMWLTGFDVKCLSCLYLDKPLKAHTLMQTIARANRVSEGKSNGLIVDYIGIVKALRKALADYTANLGASSGADPTIDKKELIARIIEVIEKTREFLSQKEFELKKLIGAVDFAKLASLQEAANAVCGSIEDKKIFTTYALELSRLIKYTDRNDVTAQTRKQYEAIAAIHSELQKKRKHTNTTNLMIEIHKIINEHVKIADEPTMNNEAARRFDISAIDFELLRSEFAKVKTKNLAMKDLEEIIKQKLDSMLFSNPNRIDYYERYGQIIAEYNTEQDRATIEKTFMELMDLANQMSKEEQRYAREGFTSDEELSFYDMLFRDDLGKNDIKKIKEVATTLLSKIKSKISELDHWSDKQETKAEVDNLIRDTLWGELPECYDDISISACREKIYEYVYMRYRSAA
ncbi:type I restriction endonuclease subunit R [uncultured Campylobacter sp.]|uniref:type I restriction endonuclease subunit R n=1 Tax=uncultured Campylobacter sp. TaxID=218934 RepID=UPI0028EE8D93|nr:type I restriction endonuclease subunit R [uncultured Campylobacter sp.]